MPNPLQESARVEKVGRVSEQQRNSASHRPDRQGSQAPGGSQVEHERQRDRQHNDQRKLRADGEGQRQSQQHDAPPVPQHHFTRRVQRMGHGDGGEDCAEGSPGRSDLRLGRPKRAGADNARRETVKSQGNISAGIAEEAAGHVPERSAQQQPKHQIRQRGRPVQTSNILRLQRDRPQPQRGGGNQVPERRMMRIVAAGLERGDGISLRVFFRKWAAPTEHRPPSRRGYSKARCRAPAGKSPPDPTVPGRTPFPTSQRHCARNTSSRHAASTCGRPNRSRLKNRTMENRRVFYHGEGRIGKLPRDGRTKKQPAWRTRRGFFRARAARHRLRRRPRFRS